MDQDTKEKALEKLRHMLPLVAYPDEILDDKKLINYYKNLTIDPHSYLKTKLKINFFRFENEVISLTQSIDKSDWTGLYGKAAVVNAFYDPKDNSIG